MTKTEALKLLKSQAAKLEAQGESIVALEERIKLLEELEPGKPEPETPPEIESESESESEEEDESDFWG